MAEIALVPAVILAGGLSRRMGEDKALIRLGETPLALHVAARLAPQVSTVHLNAPAEHVLSDTLPILSDSLPDRPGPLAGVLAGMTAFSERPNAPTHVLTTPCDTPFLPRDLVRRLAEQADGGTIVIAAAAGRTHPVTALWPVALAADLKLWLDDPTHRRVFDFVARHRTKTVEFPLFDGPFGAVDPFFNINTPEDLALARIILERGVL
ncbi:molybdenum cofactor guanylyltransferase [Rhizobium sp. WL3]|uniref:molybdenum cofactor guanylyltransferase MobA n=1 Tax=Rhizobium sp. WL3 TaxID=2603277 RepID=UPI0011C1D36E|nr:molybdenum cofactor guanylyltransferase MobA [Rhizobium sp. WL3]QEE44142.1 molybdenum cofactor guanylyltransferase [Rhizobium sp. WL3]